MSQQRALIHVTPKSAMQSGRGRSQGWTLRFTPGERQRLDPLMGWAGSGDTNGQVSLHFATRDEAVGYAEARGIPYEVEEPKPARPIKPKVYAENFRFGRPENWSH